MSSDRIGYGDIKHAVEEKHDLLESESAIFLTSETMDKFTNNQIGSRLTQLERDDLREFCDYMYGFFPQYHRWVTTRIVLNFLYNRK